MMRFPPTFSTATACEEGAIPKKAPSTIKTSSSPSSSGEPPAPTTSADDPERALGRGAQRGRREPPPDEARTRPQHVNSKQGSSGTPADDDPERALGRGAQRGRREPPPDEARTRPQHVNSKKGSSGTSVSLSANYFNIPSPTTWSVYHYSVDFAPEEDRTWMRKKLMAVQRTKIGGYLFDGSSLFVTHRLHPDTLVLFSPREPDDTKIRLTLTMRGELSPGDHHIIQILNIIVKTSLDALHLQVINRNVYDAEQRIILREHNLEMWPGYITSIRQMENSLMMCADIAHKVLRTDTAHDLLMRCVRQDRTNYRSLFHKAIVGSIVITDYNTQTYRIDDVDFDASPEDTFPRKGTEITYAAYYEKKYCIKIRDRSQPLLLSKTTARERRAGQPEYVSVVPELCRATGLDDAQRANFHLMRSVADVMRVSPESRLERLVKFRRRMETPESRAVLKAWDLKMEMTPVEFKGRELVPEKIFDGDKKGYTGPNGNETDWYNNLHPRKMYSSNSLENWSVICPNRQITYARNFCKQIQTAVSKMSFHIADPNIVDVADVRVGSFLAALEQVIGRNNPQLIMIVVPNNDALRYAAIKKLCCVDRAVPTQVIVAKSLIHKNMVAIATKVGIQISCKIGGTPWIVDIPPTDIMFCGFDVCHDTANRCKSYGALVCSLNQHLTRYFSVATAHTRGEELSNYIGVNMIAAAHAYRAHNHRLPRRIILYRDGVGEGQLHVVHTHEVQRLKAMLTEAYGDEECRLTVVIVTKRILTRIFRNDSRGPMNPKAGTVVDDVITNPLHYDFFLVSQSVRQGTASPTSYNIIYDESRLSPEQMQKLTYKLTHLYYNWCGTVSVPAPVQYAHKLAFLVGQSLHQTPNNALNQSLYFL